MEFDRFLRRIVRLSSGVISHRVLRSGEIVTPYTLRAEIESSFFTGVEIPTDITLAELRLISDFNAQATQGLLDCDIRSIILPLLGDHVLRESNHFIRLLKSFQRAC